MNSIALREFGQVLNGNQIGRPNADLATQRADAEVGIAELRVLNADVDLVSPEAAEPAEHLVHAFLGGETSGDHLRLPQMTKLDPASMNAAIGRVLAVGRANASGEGD